MKIASFCSKFAEKRLVFSRRRLKKAASGSVLLEVAIGIFILTIISGFFVRKNILINRSLRDRTTRENIETTATALAAFVANNNRLPRPSSNNDGIESSSAVSCGFVPYKTLGLSERTAKDGNLRPLVYIVEKQLTENFPQIYASEEAEGCFCNALNRPTVIIADHNNKNDPIAFVLDTEDHKHTIGERITINPSCNTFRITRDLLLMRYLKNSPCSRPAPPVASAQGNNIDDLDDL